MSSTTPPNISSLSLSQPGTCSLSRSLTVLDHQRALARRHTHTHTEVAEPGTHVASSLPPALTHTHSRLNNTPAARAAHLQRITRPARGTLRLPPPAQPPPPQESGAVHTPYPPKGTARQPSRHGGPMPARANRGSKPPREAPTWTAQRVPQGGVGPLASGGEPSLSQELGGRSTRRSHPRCSP